MIESKLLLIAEKDQQRWRSAMHDANLPAALISALHEEKMTQRYGEYGDTHVIFSRPTNSEKPNRK